MFFILIPILIIVSSTVTLVIVCEGGFVFASICHCDIFHGEVACFPLAQPVKGLWGPPCQWIDKWSYFESWHQCMGSSRRNQVFNLWHFVLKMTYESTHGFILPLSGSNQAYCTLLSYPIHSKRAANISADFSQVLTYLLENWEKHNKSVLFKVQRKTTHLRVFGARTITIVQALLIRSHILFRCVYWVHPWHGMLYANGFEAIVPLLDLP